MFIGVGVACQILRGDGLRVMKNVSVKQRKRRENSRGTASPCLVLDTS